jgi:hypothetical protein
LIESLAPNLTLSVMRKFLSITSLFILFVSYSFAQSDNPAGAGTVVLTNWSAAPTNISGVLGATGSGLAVCSGSDVDDVWYKFTSTTQAVRIIGNTTGFNMVLELWTNGPGSQIVCQNANTGNTGETLLANTLTPGGQYYLRVRSNGVTGTGAFTISFAFLPKANIRSSYTPNPLGDDVYPGYKISNSTSRNLFTIAENATIQATRFKLEDSSNGDLFFSTVTGNSGLKNLNDFGGLCYDKTYYAWVECQVGGFWCGYSDMYILVMEAYPNTTLQPGFNAQTYDMNEFIKCYFVGDDESIEWELTTDNGATVLYHNTGNETLLYFDEVPCIRYNTIYQIRIRVNYCGLWGPWSTSYYIITQELPYTNVWPVYCDEPIFMAGTLITQFLEVVDQYGWQFAPIETGDPDMVPIGPAIVTYTPFTDCALGPLNLEQGTTYRVGTKPFVGTTDACNNPQEGDYGNFCPIHIIVTAQGSGPQQLAENNSGVKEIKQADQEQVRVFVDDNGGITFLANTQNTAIEGKVLVEVYNESGQLVKSHQFFGAEPGSSYQLPSGNLSAGFYVVRVESLQGTFTQKVVVQ